MLCNEIDHSQHDSIHTHWTNVTSILKTHCNHSKQNMTIIWHIRRLQHYSHNMIVKSYDDGLIWQLYYTNYYYQSKKNLIMMLLKI